MRKSDTMSGLIFAIMSLWLLVYAIPRNIDGGTGEYGMSSAMLPNIMALSMLVLSVLQVCVNLFPEWNLLTPGKKGVAAETDWTSHGTFWLKLIAFLASYLGLLKLLGFIPASVLFLALLQYMVGQRKYLTLGILAVVVPLVIYIAFRHGMGIMLPTSIFLQ